MPNFDLTTTQGDQPPAASPPAAISFEFVLDASKQNLAAADTADIMDLPGNIKVIAASAEVLKPEGAVATADIGISGVAADTLIDGADANAAAGTVVHSGDGTNDNLLAADGYKVPSAGGTVRLTANNALSTAILRIQVIALDLRGRLDSPV